MKLGFVITNDKASNIAREDSICLFSVAEEAALNKQQIKPCVPFETPFYCLFMCRFRFFLRHHWYKSTFVLAHFTLYSTL